MLIQPVHKYWISSKYAYFIGLVVFKYLLTIQILFWLCVSRLYSLKDCTIMSYCAVVLTTWPSSRFTIIERLHWWCTWPRCINTLRVCTFAILRKSLLCMLRHFQHQYLCENIFTVTGVSRSFAYTAGFQNTFPYDSLMAYAIFA